jgi:serine/threonine-protein kinase
MLPTRNIRASNAPDRLIGQTIRGFKILALLGQGGSGDVFLAEQRLVKTRVAIKLLRHDVTSAQQQIVRFLNEAVVVGKIKHAGTIKIFDAGFHEGRAFLVMELLEGETLAARLRRFGKLPIGEVAEILRQIVGILEATHVEGIIHRDLKPDNVFLVPDNELESRVRVKVLDYGIAKLGSGLTRTGEAIGTPGYMSPEQWESAGSVDARTDVYSLGCLGFELCCGRPPFVAKSIPLLYAQQMSESPPRAALLVPELPAVLDRLFERMLARVPAERPDIREVAAVCAALAHPGARGSDGAMSAQKRAFTGTTVALVRPRRRALWIAGALALALVGALRVRVAAHREIAPIREIWSGMAMIRAGTFIMGNTNGAKNEDHQVVILSPYWIDITEVTVQSYQWCVILGGCPEVPVTVNGPDGTERSDLSALCNHADRPNHPVNCVAWDQANAYCAWLGKRLPTEAEWEFAARGVDRRPFPWGVQAPDATHLNACGPECVERAQTRLWNERAMMIPMSPVRDRWPTTAPVGSFPEGASPFGVFDMAGNVMEWTADWSGPYSSVPVTNPTGSQVNRWTRVVRGGGWMANKDDDVRTTTRTPVYPQQRSSEIGFRCARSP